MTEFDTCDKRRSGTHEQPKIVMRRNIVLALLIGILMTALAPLGFAVKKRSHSYRFSPPGAVRLVS